jgi:ribonuclease BN (tRNA processing enzyme)
MVIQFVGAGSFFNLDEFNTNVLLTSKTDKKLLIDCGFTLPFALREANITPEEIDAVYISHLHADHIGGLEWLGFKRYFTANPTKPELYTSEDLIGPLWDSLRGGMASLQGKICTLDSYFDVKPIQRNVKFYFQEIPMQTVQTVHVMDGFKIIPSYGLIARPIGQKSVFFTTDTQFCPSQIMDFYESVDIIFHDCELTPFKSGVHANIADLKTLPDHIKEKMYLCHYQNIPGINALELGFAGFARKNGIFSCDIT